MLPSDVRLVAAGTGQCRTLPSQKGPSLTLEIDPQRWPYSQGHQNRHNKKGKKKRIKQGLPLGDPQEWPCLVRSQHPAKKRYPGSWGEHPKWLTWYFNFPLWSLTTYFPKFLLNIVISHLGVSNSVTSESFMFTKYCIASWLRTWTLKSNCPCQNPVSKLNSLGDLDLLGYSFS